MPYHRRQRESQAMNQREGKTKDRRQTRQTLRPRLEVMPAR